VDAQSQKLVSIDALPVGVGNTPVENACTADLVNFLTSIDLEWLKEPFIANRVIDMEALRKLTTTDLMKMDIAQNPSDFLFHKLKNRDQARIEARCNALVSGIIIIRP